MNSVFSDSDRQKLAGGKEKEKRLIWLSFSHCLRPKQFLGPFGFHIRAINYEAHS
jgi:hypothetical protein